MKLVNLKVESCVNPVGVDEKKPGFSWQIETGETDVFQDAYRITVREESGKTVWDSGKTEKSDMVDVPYDGEPLKTDTRYTFEIEAWVNGQHLISETGRFTTGLLGKPFAGKWITPEKGGIVTPETCPFVRKTFKASPVVYATFFIYSYGWYEFYINGRKTDDRLLSPAKSSYKSILYYDSYDVTDFLVDGENVISLILGDGYNSNANPYMGRWSGAKRLIASLRLHYADGTVQEIGTDESWKYISETPFICNNLYNGELYDATREIPGWQMPGYEDSGWQSVYLIEEKTNAIFSANIGPFIKVMEEREPEKIYPLKDGRYILDFGQNMAGFIRFSLSGERGSRIRIETAEEFGENAEDGFSLNTETNRQASATDTYIFKGEGTEVHQPLFTYHGFRYAEISGLTHAPRKGEFIACVLHTEFPFMSKFQTDHAMINRVFQNAVWSIKSNSFSFPTDCPARDERTPCNMDLYAYLESAMYFTGHHAYYARYAKNEIMGAKERKKITMTWDGCIIALPWYLYHFQGNRSLIDRYYPEIKAFEDQYLAQCPDLIPPTSFGDWCAPNKEGDYLTSFSCCDETEQHAMIFTCRMMRDMSRLVGREDEAAYYEQIANRAVKIYIERFYDREKHTFSDGKQAPNLFALVDEILPKEERKAVAENLINSILQNGNHLDVGIYGIRHFLRCLAESGAVDTALDCYLNTEFPSFLYQIERGATTLWEQWCGQGDMASHNHAMFAGSISGFYSCLAGIVPTKPAFREICVKPVLTRYIHELETSVETPFGVIAVSYQIRDGRFYLKLHIPPNGRAKVILPDGTEHSIGNGNYCFEQDVKECS